MRFTFAFLLLPFLLNAAELPTLRVGDAIVSIATYGRNPAQQMLRPKVALVLSGGGARGFAHIPVIESIERAGIPVDMVLGTSMGALVGGLYASGYSPGDMRRLIESYDMIELFALPAVPPARPEPMPLRRDRDNLFVLGFDSGGLGTASGIIGDQRILFMLNDSLSRVAGITDFDRLAIPFRCIGTDVVTGERIVFSSGSLVTAIRASISIPIVFTPYPVGDRLLVDGGLVDNMPVSLAREMSADIIIAVDVNAVDYDVEASDLESLTAMLSQLVVILTKNTVVGQLSDTDLLIMPELTEHGILDFDAVDEIIAVGEASAEAHTQDFVHIAQEIALNRPLQVLDPERYGPYFTLPDVFVRSVSRRSLQGDPPSLELELFSEYIGFPLDTLRKRHLGELFEELRDSGRFATVSYDYTNVSLGRSGAVWGNLEIQTRNFNPKRSLLSAGLYGATSITFTESGTSFEFRPDFSLRFFQYGPLDWSLQIANDDALHFSALVSKDISDFWRFGLEVGYVTGGIHPTNLRSSFKGSEFRDRVIRSELMAQYMLTDRLVLKVGADADYIWYGEPATSREVFIPMVRLEGVYTTMPYGFFPKKGLRLDFSGATEVTEGLGYRMEGRFQAAVSLGRRDVLLFDLHGGSSHVAHHRKQSYIDYGGTRGMPSYPGTTLVDDMVLARVKHFRWLTDQSVDLLVQTMVAAGFRGNFAAELLDSDPFATNFGHPFSSLQEFEASASVALGVSFDTLDILLGLALDDSLRVTLFLEIL